MQRIFAMALGCVIAAGCSSVRMNGSEDKRRISSARQSTGPEPPGGMQRLKEDGSAEALLVAKDFGVTLDFSPNSIKHVESILGKFHADYRKTKSGTGLHGIALMFGAYIVVVIERNFGPVEWERDHPEFGKGTFPLQFGTKTLFPVAWCEKRLFDGPGDNVWFKFQQSVIAKKQTE
jgi:hypothetical protein